MSVSWYFPAAANIVVVATLLGLANEPVDLTSTAPRDRTMGPPAPAASGQPDFSAIGRDQVKTRPLFATDRRPWQPPPAPAPVVAPAPKPVAAKAPAPPPEIVLLGIGVVGGRARALLLDDLEGETAWLSEGESAWNWIVRDISGRSVTIEHATGKVALDLDVTVPGG